MDNTLQNLIDARNILGRAYGDTIGMGPAHEMIWRAIEYIDKQKDPLIFNAISSPDRKERVRA